MFEEFPLLVVVFEEFSLFVPLLFSSVAPLFSLLFSSVPPLFSSLPLLLLLSSVTSFSIIKLKETSA